MRVPARFARDLARLRAGDVGFDAFARMHLGVIRGWAVYHAGRWQQRALCVDDLVQEALLEAWRAVDAWDPGRGVAIDRYVEFCVNRRLDDELRRVTGWPVRKRGTRPVVPVGHDFQTTAALRSPRVDSSSRPRSITKDVAMYEAQNAVSQPELDRENIRRLAAQAPDELAAVVVVGIGIGLTLEVVAAQIYADAELRRRYRFDSREMAGKRVAAAARRAVAAVLPVRHDDETREIGAWDS